MTNTQIDITENGTTTLATAGKYCDRNIDVNVNVVNNYGLDTLASLIDRSITSVVISDGVETIGVNSFANCINLVSVTLPSSVKLIKQSAFTQCSKLDTINFEEGLEVVESMAFSSCNELTTLNLPSTLQTIGPNAFSSNKLATVTFKGTPTFISSTAFSASNLTIYVPWSEGAVANAPWGAYNATIHYNSL